ncbi:V-set and transmembrane domain-containing protein 2-like protein isoform X1 [Synchiropus splendidus]|uniref:V-set and transmembrane domain-containing protein 2-like protein isoform X1 n=1 Tax=Synchiropus splendidus TaxID=270530 RepID=UPI00237D9754|nr:V-set and transmembrane domain-containing protein 2-like protein isoform X1 [Synchiropus splendidus]
MEAFRLLLGTFHYLGLYVQLGASMKGTGPTENHITGNAVFTEVPHDVSAQRGQDVEMACSFRGAGTPSYSLEIQWWYIRNHQDWTDTQPWTTNQVAPEEELPQDATKISVVKVVGSNISHKLRLSRVKQSDEGFYECRVIDYSDDAGARRHRVRAYLQVAPDSSDGTYDDNFQLPDSTKPGYEETHGTRQRHPEHGRRSAPRQQPQPRKRDAHSHDCSNEASCSL